MRPHAIGPSGLSPCLCVVGHGLNVFTEVAIRTVMNCSALFGDYDAFDCDLVMWVASCPL